jgi:hypothetical protein
VYGYRRRGRQSRFVDAEYERFDHAGRPVDSDNDSYIKRDGTLNGIATGERTVVVGGYRGSDRSVADYSAGGDDEKTVRGPDALAVSERSAARPGILAAGTRSGGSKFALSGTSVAAPQVSGWIAKQMARGEYFGPYSVRAKASQDDPATSLKDPPGVPGTRPPAKRGGNGRLEITR